MIPRTTGTSSVSGLILAGGASSRFGEPKALAMLKGRPLVSWVAASLAPLCGQLLVSVGVRDRMGAFRTAVPAARFVRDRYEDRGPIEGLRRGIDASRGEIVLVAPSDAPLLRPSLYTGLLRILGDHEAAIPRPEVLDPVRAVYRRDAVLRTLARHGEAIRSPSALADRLDAVFLEGSSLHRADPSLASFVDVNRREDLEHAHRLAADLV